MFALDAAFRHTIRKLGNVTGRGGGWQSDLSRPSAAPFPALLVRSSVNPSASYADNRYNACGCRTTSGGRFEDAERVARRGRGALQRFAQRVPIDGAADRRSGAQAGREESGSEPDRAG